MATISTAYNGSYALCPYAPIEYMRALAEGESSQNPKDQTGTKRGLLQVGEDVLADYNKAKGEALKKTDLFIPAVNVRVWCWWLQTFLGAAKKLGIAPLATPDWDDEQFVKLVTAAWNSGWSAKAGVLYMVKWLTDHGFKVTHDEVFAHAKEADATKHLASEAKKKWQAAVWLRYRLLKVAKALPGGGVNVPKTTSAEELRKEAQKPTKSKNGGMSWALLVLLLLWSQSKR